MAGVKQACETRGVGLDALSLILHGSTVVTNMILEEKGAVGGLLTTAGHEQILHLARAWTPGPLYAWMGMIKPDPLVPLWLHARGRRTDRARPARSSPSSTRTRSAQPIKDLLGVGHRVADDRVPQRLRELRRTSAGRARSRSSCRPDLPVSISSDLVSEYREYERTLTAVLNSYTQPQVIKYVDGLESLLARRRVRRPPEHRALRRRHDERPLDEGAAGRHRVLRPVRRRGRRGVPRPPHRACRTSSPSTWAAPPPTSRSAATARCRSSARRSSATTTFQARGADIHSVGAGGGSIAYLNLAGALKVGPRSAGADAGPRLLRPGRDGADGHRRQRRPRPPARRLEARRPARARRRRGQDGPSPPSPRAWASTPSPPRRRSSTSPTRTCTPRCASCPWSAATTRAISASSPSAAPARCTPTRSPA